MSATFKHDIGQAIYALLEATCPTAFVMSLGAKDASRWAGLARARRGQRYECVTFSLRVPRDMETAWKLYRYTSGLQVVRPNPQTVVTSVAVNGCAVLAAKMLVSLGLPAYVATGEELGFLAAIDETPGELSTWGGYADWLQDRDDDANKRRGRHITNLLAKKAMKTSGGTPRTCFDPGDDYDYKTFPNYKRLPREDFIGKSLAQLVPDIFEDVK